MKRVARILTVLVALSLGLIGAATAAAQSGLGPAPAALPTLPPGGTIKVSLPLVWKGVLPSGSPPGVPIIDAIVNDDLDNTFAVTWSAVEGADSYLLEEAADGWFEHPVRRWVTTPRWETEPTGRRPGMLLFRVCATNKWGRSVWSDTVMVTIHRVHVGLRARWDSMGYIRGSEQVDVGYHETFTAREVSGPDRVRLYWDAWYDPNPYGYPADGWWTDYSIWGEYVDSSFPPGDGDSDWGWGFPWILPYAIHPKVGEHWYIGGVTFVVDGPFDGDMTFGTIAPFWEFTNVEPFAYWVGEDGRWQAVPTGGAGLRYHAGGTGLLLHANVTRYYVDGDRLTGDTVQYVTNLTSSTALPGSPPVPGTVAPDTTASSMRSASEAEALGAARALPYGQARLAGEAPVMRSGDWACESR